MFKGLISIHMPKVTLARISSGLTAFVCAGILANAILTDNGGEPDAQQRWQQAGQNSLSIVDQLDGDFARKWHEQNNGLDATITNSIIKKPSADKAKTPGQSVLSLIRQNSDVSPSVSSGTDRVSVIVRSGDTLYSLAKRHGLKVKELAGMNGLEEPYVIRIGQTLYVAR